MQVRLYSTWGCHLCEDAARLLDGLTLDYQTIDIVDDEAAYQKYRYEIPVVVLNQLELKWPFNALQLQALLATAATSSLVQD